jgi:hypothetical protein
MSDRTIKEAISKLSDTYAVDAVFYVNAVVDSVDIDNRTCTCTVTEGTTEYQLINVKLMAVVDDGILFEPAIGSSVRVIYTKTKESFIVQYSEIENIYIDAKTKIIFNHGENTMAKADVLKTQLDKCMARIDGIINAINSNTIIPAPNDGGADLLSFLRVQIALIVDKEDYSEIENKSILHGE